MRVIFILLAWSGVPAEIISQVIKVRQQCLTNRCRRRGSEHWHLLREQSDLFILSNHKSPSAVFNQAALTTRRQVLAWDNWSIQRMPNMCINSLDIVCSRRQWQLGNYLGGSIISIHNRVHWKQLIFYHYCRAGSHMQEKINQSDDR